MLSDTDIALRLLAATLLSGIIGLERERGERAAGLRTHALVGLGSCLVMIVSAFGFEDWHYSPGALDPSRIAAQVVSGIGFLGAGVIIFQRDGGAVRGLTTAASVWVVAAIGLAVGGGDALLELGREEEQKRAVVLRGNELVLGVGDRGLLELGHVDLS